MTERKLEDLFSLMEEVGRSLFKDLHLELRGMPLQATVQQMFVCVSLSRCGGRVTVTDLAREMGVSLSAITATTNRINKLGLLQRFRDETDHRVVWLRLTAEGMAGVDTFSTIQKRVMCRYFNSLSPEELEYLYRIYQKLRSLTKNNISSENIDASC